MTDVAVDASTLGGPEAALDWDWLPEVDPADVLGCSVLAGLGVAPVPASAEAGWLAAGVGLGPGLGAWLGATGLNCDSR
jgi:hypothetical protein